MRFGGFRFGRFFRCFLIRLDPFGVKNAGLIDSFVRVRTEEIALRLQEVRRQPSRPITVEVSERCGKCRNRDAVFNGCCYRNAPVALRLFDGSREITIEQKVVERRIALISLDDSVEKFRANDAAAPPDGGDIAEVEVPFVFRASRTQKLHSLRVRNNFRCVKRVAYCIDESRSITRKLSSSRLWQNLRGGLPFFFSRRNNTRFNGSVNCRNDEDRKSTRLNSSHSQISYAVFCLKKKQKRARSWKGHAHW